MNAAELRALGGRLKLVDPLFPGDYDRIAEAAEIIELIAWAEEHKETMRIDCHNGSYYVQTNIHDYLNDRAFFGPTLIDTLRRAREAAR